MPCKLIEQAKAETLTEKAISQQVVTVEKLFDSAHIDICLSECKECGQMFLNCMSEYTTGDWDDDLWRFWVPLSAVDIEAMRKAPRLTKFAGELVRDRAHICKNPEGKISWSSGCLVASVLF
jgi:hypothetical protein